MGKKVRTRARRERPLLRLGLVLAVAAAALPPWPVEAAARYREGDDAVVALNILPPGQKGVYNAAEAVEANAGSYPPHSVDQLQMYSDLTFASRGDLEQLTRYFKDASFGVPPGEVEREYSPRPGVRILRDRAFGVPHIYGETREDAFFGAGYVSAEDRLFLMDVMRHVGRCRMSEFLGASEANLAMDRSCYKVSGYDEADLQRILDDLVARKPEVGGEIVRAFRAFSDGVNAYISEALADPSKLPAEYPALQQVPEPWRPTDTVAVASLIGSQLGVGGGGELKNARLLKALTERLGVEEGRRVFEDLRERDDPEAPVHTLRTFPYMPRGRADPRAVAMPDDPEEVASALPTAPDHLDGPFGPIKLFSRGGMSNAVLIGSSLSASGRPFAVFGPQVGYWSPEILLELDVHGPGIHARGAAFPGVSLLVLLGRGAGYAWSATSAGADQVDVVAELLCEPGGGEPTTESTHYLYRGECRPMETRTDTWVAKPSAGGLPSGPELVVTEKVERTVHGIVQARGKVGGRPVAFVRARTTFFKEVDSAEGFLLLNNPEAIKGPEDFRKAAQKINFSFNWFYLDAKHIAYQLSGAYPVRASGVDPDLPSWGTGEWDWRGEVPGGELPWDVDPPGGYILSWNNKQAPGWSAADDNYSFGPVHRVQMLKRRVEEARAGGKLALADAVWVMADAATVDLRGQELLPLLLEALGEPSPDLGAAVDLLRMWAGSGAHRLDRDRDGRYEQAAAVALMDAWWPRAIGAVFDPTLGGLYELVPMAFDNPPGPLGSAYQFGWYGYVSKDLRRILGKEVAGPFHRVYCGGGDRDRCREALAASLRQAVAELVQKYGEDPGGWDSDGATEAKDRIRFTSVGLVGVPDLPWVNRPTFQQVVEFGSFPGQGPEAGAGGSGRRELPATGSPVAAGMALASLAAAAAMRRVWRGS